MRQRRINTAQDRAPNYIAELTVMPIGYLNPNVPEDQMAYYMRTRGRR